MRRKRIRIILLIFILIVTAVDVRLKTVTYDIYTDKINQPVKLALITDLHSCYYGQNQEKLIQAINKQTPDVILLGGDIFDDNQPRKNTIAFLKGITEQYPCYYVTGNHEYWSNDIENILNILKDYGVTLLSGECKQIDINGQIINIGGIDDPDAQKYTNTSETVISQLNHVTEQQDSNYTILLSHRPELIETYMRYSFDLILVGHAHGGQWRIPLILNGLLAPNQGLFPKYAGGLYEFEKTKMIVSRGLARESTRVPRIYNRPEVVIVNVTRIE